MSKFSKFKNDLSKKVIEENTGSKASTSKVFMPGQYDVKIAGVEEQGANRYDPSWLGYKFTFEGVGEKTINEWINVPTEDTASPALDGIYENSTFNRLIRFLSVLGLDVTQPTSDLLTQAFEKPETLVGAHVKITVGYRGPHADYVKADGGYRILNRDNQVMADEIFETRDAVAAYVQQAGIKGFKAFPSVLKYEASDVKNEIGAKKVVPPTKRLVGKNSIPSGL